ncbi:hypothetical protein [Botrimarina hoheduenensis]|uniref:Uncharacterized protein n=1 Tax=Botrimarina hoheduenensis TaxID=2528000 RepID=A0A5C5VN65_9BACT|nr:hypothetical protein [Botrimarina hoheduenensis]TWT40106.1 hypothetical protein Pla111_34350 [Botrimarina hoheduenensis]
MIKANLTSGKFTYLSESYYGLEECLAQQSSGPTKDCVADEVMLREQYELMSHVNEVRKLIASRTDVPELEQCLRKLADFSFTAGRFFERLKARQVDADLQKGRATKRRLAENREQGAQTRLRKAEEKRSKAEAALKRAKKDYPNRGLTHQKEQAAKALGISMKTLNRYLRPDES